jgi:hypothetical protein
MAPWWDLAMLWLGPGNTHQMLRNTPSRAQPNTVASLASGLVMPGASDITAMSELCAN